MSKETNKKNESKEKRETIEVDYINLGRVLRTIYAPSYHLAALKRLPEDSDDNPLASLMKSYNSYKSYKEEKEGNIK